MAVDKVKGGYKNVSKSGETFSKKPLTKAKAESQLRAIEASKHGATMRNKGKRGN